MTKKTIFILMIFTALSCKKETKEIEYKERTPNKEVPSNSANSGNCYEANLDGNVIELQINYNAEDITGTLTYAFTGKEVTSGAFKGKLENNILIADYTYLLENETRERQIAFKMIDDQFVEGYGERMKNSTKFKDISKLEFNSNMPLRKVDCP